MGRKGTATQAMQSALRCGAKTRSGKPCAAPAVTGRNRCRLHGGADGVGAPVGNTNALKHGRFTKKAIFERRQVKIAKRLAKAFLKKNGLPR